MRSPLVCLACLLTACAASTGGNHPGGQDDLAGAVGADLTIGQATEDLSSGAVEDLAPPPVADLAQAPDLVPPGMPAGLPCATDNDCQTHLCRPVLFGQKSVCVAPCTSQGDCAGFMNLFCEPTQPGAQAGYCVPRSPAHCASCAHDSDCGVLSEACVAGPGDPSPACHIDCAIAGAAACPQDYSCTSLTVAGVPRKMCVPNPVAGVPVACLDALGGFCDRFNLPLPCVRTNTAGTCTGQRTCLTGTGRYDQCGAPAPQFKTSCTQMDPAGCALQYQPGIADTSTDCGTCGHSCNGLACCNATCTDTTTVANCGGCGVVCPGQGTTASTVSCTGGQCQFVCQGEHYDVDGNPANGCEVADSPTGNHTQGSATNLGSSGCNDGDSAAVINGHITGIVPSDERTHSPSVAGFDSGAGDAPDVFVINATGGTFCQNDLNLSLQVVGASYPSCYQVSALTSDGRTYSCQTNSNGACSISNGAGSYGNGNIFITISKHGCPPSDRDNASYSVTGHL